MILGIMYNPRKRSYHLLQQPNALHLKDFMEHFGFTRRVATNKSKITHKPLNLQHLSLFRNDVTAFSRIILNKSVKTNLA